MTWAVVQALVLWMLLYVLVSVILAAVAILTGVGVGGLTHAQQHPVVIATWLVVSLLIDAVGGWRAARLAGENEMAVSAAFGGVVMILAAVVVVLSPPHARTTFDVVGVVATIPAAVLGGLIARR